MKEMINEIRNIDVYEQLHTLKEIVFSFLESYKQNNSWKIRVLDSFIVFCVFTFVLQFLYVIVNGLFPMNSLLAGLICSLGSITLAVSLRFQVNPKTKVDNYSNEKAFAEYMVASFILYFVCINFLG